MKNLLSLVFVFLSALCAYGQKAIKYPYTYGMHTYVIGDKGQRFYDECKKNGIDYIEVNPGEYGSGNYQQIVSGSKKTKEYMDKAGVVAWSVHLPYGGNFEISAPDENFRKGVVTSLTNYIKALADVFKPQRMVLHPSWEPIPIGKERETHIQQAIKSVKELSEVAKQKGVVLCIENLPRTCLGNTPDELLRIVTPSKSAAICYDTNHNLQCTYDEFIRKTGHLIKTLHVSDYDYTNERHWLPGMGKLPWGDLILMLEECGYKGVFMNESDNNATGYTNPTETREHFDKIMKEYEEVKADPVKRMKLYMKGLQDRYWDGKDVHKVFVAGNEIGCYKKEAVDKFFTLYDKIEKEIKSATATAEEFAEMRQQMAVATQTLLKSVNQLTDGYYNIVSAHEGFTSKGKQMAMYADNDMILKWKAFEPAAQFIFHLKKVNENEYSIQNMGNMAYVGTQPDYYTPIPMTKTHKVNQCIEFLPTAGMAKIFNVENSVAYHAESHQDGAGTAGNIVIWNSSPLEGSGSSWSFKKVDMDDMQFIDIPASGYTTFYSDKAIALPKDIMAGVVTGMDVENQYLKIDWMYDGKSNVVPAHTAVLISGTAGKYIYKNTQEKGVAPEHNLLKGTAEETMTEGSDMNFYKMTVEKNEVAFAWGAENGVAFKNKANTAYLALPKAETQNASVFYLVNHKSGTPCFAVISDVHLGGSGSEVKVPRAFKNLIKEEPNLDAIFICGDLTDYGFEYQYEQLEKILNDRSIIPANIKVYAMMGNHDNYKDHDATFYTKHIKQPLHQYINIKGYPCITISTRGTYNSGTTNHDEEAYNFLSKSLAKAAKEFPGKPIFVFDHYPAAGTVYGSENWGNPRLYEIMKDYPQVIAFSGHSHFPLCDPRSIYQKDFTSINDGNISYSEINPGEVTEGIHPAGHDEVNEGCIVKVDAKSNVLVERWNTSIDKGILPSWEIKAPHDGKHFLYTNRTGGEKPVFADDVKVKVSDITTDQCKVTFKQATDDENVHHYLIEILQDNSVVASNKIFSGFYLLDNMPTTLSVNLKGIPSNVILKARVIAYDSFDNASEPLYSNPFSTKEYKPAPGTSRPVADLLEVSFGKDGQAKDVSAKKTTVALGQNKPTTYFNELYNAYAGTFDGSWKTYYKIDYSKDNVLKKAFKNHFTLELLCKPNSTDDMCPFSGQESGGFGLEQLDGGVMSFYAHIDGSYQILKSSSALEPGKYYHIVATYDKAASKICLYVNGNPVDEMKVSGELDFPDEAEAQWIGIGADAKDNTTGQFAFDGDIIMANIYDKAVSRDEVYWMHKYAEDKKNNGYTPTPGSAAPVADLFDIQFNNDGTATDISQHKVDVKCGSTKPSVAESDHYEMQEASFPGSYYCYYRINYNEDETIKKALENEFTVETLYSPANTDDICPLSAQESGGFGIEHDSKGTIQFYIHLGGGYQILKSNVQVVPGKYYHVVASYNKAAGQAKMYVNGMFAGSISVSGDFGFPPAGAQWVAIGGDSHDGDYAQYNFEGQIALARMYAKTVNRDDIYWMYKAVEEKKKSTEYHPNYDVKKPVADLLDLKINADGTVKDLSAAKQKIAVGTSTPEVKHNAVYNREEAVFTGTSQSFYGIDYSDNEGIKNAFQNGFAFEVLYSTNNANDVCPMSSQQYGGCGIEQLTGGNIGFYINFTESGSSLLKSNINAVPGRYYHVIATYNKEDHLVSLYVDGKLCAKTTVEGDFKFSSYDKAHWIGIGGDSDQYGIEEGAQYCLNGSIMIARIYGKSLSLDEVYWLYNGLEGEKTASAAQNVLNMQGTGYPVAEAGCRNALKAAIKVHADSRCAETDNNTLREAIHTYKMADYDIQMPESGKAYQLVNVGKYGKKYYLETTEKGSSWQEDADKATTYVCKDLGNGQFMLVNNSGKYFTWFGKAGGFNKNLGYSDKYTTGINDLKIQKMVAGKNVDPFEDTDLFGLVNLCDNKNHKYITVSAEGEAMTNSAVEVSDDASSSIFMQEVTYANHAKMNTIAGELIAIEGAKSISTFSAPFAFVLPEKVSAFYISPEGLEADRAILTKVEKDKAIPAHQGVILTSEEEATEAVMVPASAEEEVVISKNVLENTAGAAKDLSGTFYLLGNNENQLGFFLGNTGTLDMNKAYLPIEGAQAKSIKMVWNEEITGIDAVLDEKDANAPIYDLSGRRVLNTKTDGIYIQKGKKFIVK